MAFPGPYARVIYNEDGEPLGWDNDYPDEAPYFEDLDERRDYQDHMFDACQDLMVEREGRDSDELYCFWKARQDIPTAEDAYWAWKEQQA